MFDMRALLPLLPAFIGQDTGGTIDSNPLVAILSFIGVSVALVVVLFLAYKTTRLVAGRYSVQSVHGGYVEILERVMLGQDRAIFIVRMKDKVLLLGVTPNHIEKLDELDPALYVNVPAQGEGAEGFSAILMDALGGLAPKSGKKKD